MSTPEETPDTEGGRLIAGRYRLGAELGGGAMGTVWSGTDELLRRPVAIKEIRLPPGMPAAEAAEVRERALREARAIAVVTHPSVVTLYDVAREEDGEPFVVMELVPSQSLATIVQDRGPLDDQQLALIAESVASALDAAHRAGIIHRDVKPGNVLIGDAGQIKLSDFGISRNIAESTLTKTGIMLGTPAYIAPEVASGAPLSPAADLWGLGATLFAASEGVPPYDIGDDPLDTVSSVVHDEVPRPSRTGPIKDVIAGLMVKNPAERMPLHEVRRRVQPILPESRFEPLLMLLDPKAPTLHVAHQQPARSTTQRETPEPSEGASLAKDPGPLPFTPREPVARRGRRGLAIAALTIAAVIVFAVAVGGGFLAGRMLVAQPTPPPPPPPSGGPQLVRHSEVARQRSETAGGQFTMLAPAGWTRFHTERDENTAGNKAVQFVSPDGRSRVMVQRFGGFISDGRNFDEVLKTLRDNGSHLIANFPVATSDPGGAGLDRRLIYETSERSIDKPSQQPLDRVTVAQLMARHGDLWLVSATTPGPRSEAAQTLFNQVLPGFSAQT